VQPSVSRIFQLTDGLDKLNGKDSAGTALLASQCQKFIQRKTGTFMNLAVT
jgi:hypothetical protein